MLLLLMNEIFNYITMYSILLNVLENYPNPFEVRVQFWLFLSITSLSISFSFGMLQIIY